MWETFMRRWLSSTAPSEEFHGRPLSRNGLQVGDSKSIQGEASEANCTTVYRRTDHLDYILGVISSSHPQQSFTFWDEKAQLSLISTARSCPWCHCWIHHSKCQQYKSCWSVDKCFGNKQSMHGSTSKRRGGDFWFKSESSETSVWHYQGPNPWTEIIGCWGRDVRSYTVISGAWKISHEISLVISYKMGDGECKVEDLLKILLSELQAQERAASSDTAGKGREKTVNCCCLTHRKPEGSTKPLLLSAVTFFACLH